MIRPNFSNADYLDSLLQRSVNTVGNLLKSSSPFGSGALFSGSLICDNKLACITIVTDEPIRINQKPNKVEDEPQAKDVPPNIIEVKNDGTTTSQLRNKEEVWIHSHYAELQQYAGEWIVLEEDQVVAHHSDLQIADMKAKALGIQIPYLIKVPATDELPFTGYRWNNNTSR